MTLYDYYCDDGVLGTTFDRPTLVRLIQKIEISERYTVDDHKERDIQIYYNFVGYIQA